MYNNIKERKHQLFLTVTVAETLRSSSFGKQGAEPAGIHVTKFEAPQAQGTVVEVQTQTAQQLNDCGPITQLHTHSQSPAEVLLVCTSADQELHQLQRSASLTHLQEKPG